MHDLIALAVPLFFLLIGIELSWARRRGVSVYRFTDAVTDLSCGITSQITLLLWAAAQLGIYAFVYEHGRAVTFERAWVPWLVAFVGVDFLYYWWHRFSHEVNVLWAAHVVHHQSEDYNLAVALRQAVLTSWTALPFYLPLAVLGVPPVVFAAVHALSTLYQFWIHTQLVGKVRGPLDWVLNLPSHHRVHHAINARYLDKNYGATLIVWDRLFGTYEEEVEAPVYGITKPLASFDPLWAQAHYWVELAAMTRAARRPFDKLRVWLASPAWKPEGVEITAPPVRAEKYDRPISRRLAAYLLVQYGLVSAATFAILMWHRSIPRAPLVLASLAVVGSLVAFGGLIEGKPWARAVEVARLGLAAVALAALAGAIPEGDAPVEVVAVQGESAALPRVVPPAPLDAGPSRAAPARTSMQTLDVGGVARRYLLIEPARAGHDSGARLPLVLVFHGDGGDARGFHAGFPFERATGDGAFVAYPEGIHATWDLDTKIDNRDIAFIEALVDDLTSRLPIDRARVFGAGYSSGGFFVNLVACRSSGLFRAISSSAGGAPYLQALLWPNGYPRCPGQEPVSILALHGTRDFSVTIDSGRFSAEYWAYVDGCDTTRMETTGYDECKAYRGCKDGKAVVFCTVPGLGHWVWDEAAEASWTFFLRH